MKSGAEEEVEILGVKGFCWVVSCRVVLIVPRWKLDGGGDRRSGAH